MKSVLSFEEWILENESLFADAEKSATKGIGYGTPEKARKTCEIADKMKKSDPGKAVQIVTSMMNRAKYSNGQNEDMREAIPIFQKWLDQNRKNESIDEGLILEKLWQKSVESSHLKDIEYDSDTEELIIGFKNGDRYKYYKVPKSVFREVADEKTLLGKIGSGIAKGAKKLFGRDIEDGTFGKRFWALIRRGNYKYEKI